MKSVIIPMLLFVLVFAVECTKKKEKKDTPEPDIAPPQQEEPKQPTQPNPPPQEPSKPNPVPKPNPIPTPDTKKSTPITIEGEPDLQPVTVEYPPKDLAIPILPSTNVKDTEIVIVLDTSLNMQDKLPYLNQNIDILIDFFKPLTNVRISLVAGNTNCAETSVWVNFNTSIRRYDQCVNGVNILGSLDKALGGLPFSTSNIEAIIVTNGNLSTTGFSFQKSVVVSSVVGVPYNESDSCIEIVSQEPQCTYQAGYGYMALAQRSGGKVYDICNTNWALLLIDIYNRIAQ